MKLPLSVILERKEKNKLFSVSPDSSVLEAVQLMNRERIGSVLVCDAESAVGIFTERDVLVRVVSAGKDPASTLVTEAMTSPFVAVKASTTIEEAMRIISTKRCRHLPVMGDGGEILGLISIGDLTKWIVRDQENQIEGLFDYIAGTYPA
jgi:CBS domain-containing protein